MIRLIALMFAPYAFATGAFVFAGVLGPMAEDLGVSLSAAGQLQSAFALACAFGGPVLVTLTARFGRKALLLVALGGLCILNGLSAVAPDYWSLLIARIAAGMLGAMTLPMASTIAVSLVGPERRARALAIVYAGISLAFLSGIPLGTMAGVAYGWAASFWLASIMCAVAGLLVLLLVPAVPNPPAPAGGAFAKVLVWPTTGYLFVTLLAFAAIFTVIGYVGPVVTRLTGFTGGGIGALQALTGLGSLMGLVIGTRLVESGARSPLVMLFVTIAVAQAVFAIGLFGGAQGALGLAVAIVAMALGSSALFGTAPIVQSRLAEAAGPAASLAFALNGSMVYFGQGLGVVLGGLMLAGWGLQSVSLAGILCAVIGIVLALVLRRQLLAQTAT